MISAEQNELITRVGPGTPGGALLRHYWQPVALVDELHRRAAGQGGAPAGPGPRAVPRRAGPLRPARPHCPHRGADLAFGRLEDDGLRCPFHGWLFDVDGKCLETPAEPEGSALCQHIRQRAIRWSSKSGILFA